MSANELRAKRNRLADELKRAQAELGQAESLCQHKWSEPKYTPIYHESYLICRKDPPGVGGADRIFEDIWSDPKTEDIWTRTCSKCGKEETTTSVETRTEVHKTPKFRS